VATTNARNLKEATHAEKRLAGLQRNAIQALASWRELEAHSKAWMAMQASLRAITKEVGSICVKVQRLDSVLDYLQRRREVAIVDEWDRQKNAILKNYKERSAERVKMILKERRERNVRLWESHFEEALHRYQQGGPAPEGFRYEVALLQSGKPTGKWIPCRIDFKHNDGTVDLTVAGGSSATSVQSRWIRQGRQFQNNQREKMENSLSCFKPNGVGSAELDQFYQDVSDDSDIGEDMKCPQLHELKESKEGNFMCDVCLRKSEMSVAYSCRTCDFDVCATCYQALIKCEPSFK